ncbi:hypothetical protein A2853_01405 [Candidatus Kaiserbacteria bacterium RIFCSPHIGHO2_01_FULL_55_17]|uniref:Uncharacterized protein n=1 Tax=Candidatus Kaiserbacteria bacterium RIFCSPHIGHO2_01_FULL_55_17 TaxID=1798484 RepID=A0A1F6D9N7_9BACT|nr:MAG: hypothetical protein A2853_01405 [Candidatus Kaiserbacteria bacterium RIFCSPHIGHO2_01_FULL_55_17]
MPNTLIRDYVSENGESIICRTTCYPYARWLDDSRLIIGSYVLTQEGNPNSIVTTGAEVFNAATQQFTTPTQTELASFNAATNVGVTGQSNNNSTPPVSPTDPVTISPDPVTPTDIPLEDFIYEEPVIEITDTVIGSATVAIALGESIEFRMNGTNPPTATVTLKSVSSGEATFELRSSTIRDVKTLPVGEPTILMQDSCEDELPTFRGKVLSVGASSAVLYLEALPSLIEC